MATAAGSPRDAHEVAQGDAPLAGRARADLAAGHRVRAARGRLRAQPGLAG